MLSQILLAQLKPGVIAQLTDTVDIWIEQVGRKIPGCDQIIHCLDNSGLDRIAIVIIFKNHESLKEFSDDWTTLKLFDDSKILFTGNVQYFDAITKITNLS